jgi:hypothetical protein
MPSMWRPVLGRLSVAAAVFFGVLVEGLQLTHIEIPVIGLGLIGLALGVAVTYAAHAGLMLLRAGYAVLPYRVVIVGRAGHAAVNKAQRTTKTLRPRDLPVDPGQSDIRIVVTRREWFGPIGDQVILNLTVGIQNTNEQWVRMIKKQRWVFSGGFPGDERLGVSCKHECVL